MDKEMCLLDYPIISFIQYRLCYCINASWLQWFIYDWSDRMVVGFIATYVSVPITTKAVSSNPAQGEVYPIQHYVIKFVSDLRQVVVFCGYSDFIHQYNWPPRHNWNIIESSVKHHKPNQAYFFSFVAFVFDRYNRSSYFKICCFNL